MNVILWNVVWKPTEGYANFECLFFFLVMLQNPNHAIQT